MDVFALEEAIVSLAVIPTSRTRWLQRGVSDPDLTEKEVRVGHPVYLVIFLKSPA